MQMFKLAMSPTFWATVEVEVTAEDGKRQTVKFDLLYSRLSLEEGKALAGEMEGGNVEFDDLARKIVKGWRGVAGDDGAALEFSAENFDRMLNLGFAVPIVDTFRKNLPKAKGKN